MGIFMIQFQCPRCKRMIKLGEEWQNMETECPFCNAAVVVPQVQGSEKKHFHSKTEQYNKLENLKQEQIILLYIGMLIPIVNLAVAIFSGYCYHRWKNIYPIKANHINMHAIIGFCIFLHCGYFVRFVGKFYKILENTMLQHHLNQL